MSSQEKGGLMRLRDRWDHAGQVIEEERDERLELARLRVFRPVLGAVAVVVLLAAVVLTVVPLTGHQRAEGWLLAVAVVIFAGLGTLSVTARRQHSFSPEFRAAATLRAVFLLPVVGAVFVGVVDFGWHHNVADAAGIAVSAFVGGTAGLAARYWWLSRQHSDDHG